MEQNHGVVSIHWGSRDHLYQPLRIAVKLEETRDFLVSCWSITQISRCTCAQSKCAGLSRSSLPEFSKLSVCSVQIQQGVSRASSDASPCRQLKDDGLYHLGQVKLGLYKWTISHHFCCASLIRLSWSPLAFGYFAVSHQVWLTLISDLKILKSYFLECKEFPTGRWE